MKAVESGRVPRLSPFPGQSENLDIAAAPHYAARRMKVFPSLVPLLLAVATAAQAGLVVSYAEDPGAYGTTLLHTTSYGFDDRNEGVYTDAVTSVGTYSHLAVRKADTYGGAALSPTVGSNYSLQGAGSEVTTTTLTLGTPIAYFGLWWSAGDSQNVLEFYSGGDLVARFTTASLLLALTRDDTNYFGNPGGPFAGSNASEPYAFVNFFGEGNTTWNRIVFTNASGSGFESDNHTIRDLTWGRYENEEGPLPGKVVARVEGNTIVPIPEPASVVLGAVGVLMLGLRRRRHS